MTCSKPTAPKSDQARVAAANGNAGPPRFSGGQSIGPAIRGQPFQLPTSLMLFLASA
jgi:hypothetical protein